MDAQTEQRLISALEKIAVAMDGIGQAIGSFKGAALSPTGAAAAGVATGLPATAATPTPAAAAAPKAPTPSNTVGGAAYLAATNTLAATGLGMTGAVPLMGTASSVAGTLAAHTITPMVDVALGALDTDMANTVDAAKIDQRVKNKVIEYADQQTQMGEAVSLEEGKRIADQTRRRLEMRQANRAAAVALIPNAFMPSFGQTDAIKNGEFSYGGQKMDPSMNPIPGPMQAIDNPRTKSLINKKAGD